MNRARVTLGVMMLLAGAAHAAPMYKPSAKSPAPVDISTNAYGAFSLAPKAPGIGDVVADFTLPTVDGTFSLKAARKKGDTVIVFYRGHW